MLTTRSTSNIDDVLSSARLQFPDAGERKEHVLEIRNATEYAQELHDRHGYYVMNDRVLADAVDESIQDRMEARQKKGELLTDADLVEALHEAAFATVEFYQAVIGTKNTPGQYRPPPRPRHEGQWADDSGVLASSYEHRVDGGPWEEHPYEDAGGFF